MWFKSYKDYKKDETLIKEKVQPSKGIIGCEMHDYNGWGEEYHLVRSGKNKKGLIRTVIHALFTFFQRKGPV